MGFRPDAPSMVSQRAQLGTDKKSVKVSQIKGEVKENEIKCFGEEKKTGKQKPKKFQKQKFFLQKWLLRIQERDVFVAREQYFSVMWFLIWDMCLIDMY